MIGTIAALEGAFILSRALRTTEPLTVAGEGAAARMQAALDARADAPIAAD